MTYALIPRNGLVEPVNAKLLARYGSVSVSYMRMLNGQVPPLHVRGIAEQLRRQHPWERQEEERRMDRPEPPTRNDVDQAIGNLRALCAHAEKTYGPKVGEELVRVARWLVYLNKQTNDGEGA